MFLKYLVTASRARGVGRRGRPGAEPTAGSPRSARPAARRRSRCACASLYLFVCACVRLFACLLGGRCLRRVSGCGVFSPPRSPLLPPPAVVRPFRWRSRGAPRGFPVPPPPRLPGSAGGGTGGTPRSPPRAEPPRGLCSPGPAQPGPAGAAGFGRGCSRTPPHLRPPARLCLHREPGRQFPASGIAGTIQRGNKTRQEKAGLRMGFSGLVLQGEGTATA